MAARIIFYLAAVLSCGLLLFAFKDKLKFAGFAILRGAALLLLMFILNFFTRGAGVSVGINFVTAAVVLLLGAPGAVCVYAASILL
ncbi:hypothetical protein FACS189490_09820 [Clostridia bacterium]|nr:hypothetical protein FACS189490_09820 [Clostridia bacterium]